MNLERIPIYNIDKWSVEKSIVYITINNNKFLLNKEASIVWKAINGINNIKEIILYLKENYFNEDKYNLVSEFVIETINMFIDNNIILLKSIEDIYGWGVYEENTIN